jgi:hypothetical protein
MAEYEIKIKGRVDASLLTDLGRFESDELPATTVLRGPLADPEALRRLLHRLQDRGLELVGVRQLEVDEHER